MSIGLDVRPEIPILKVTYLILSNWLKVDYILVWSLKSKLLFLSGKCFYQKVHFCRLTYDTSLENFLKGSDFFFLQSWSLQNSWKQRVLLRNHSKCFVWVAHTLLIIIVGYSTLVSNSNDPPRKYCILDVIKRLINQSRLVNTGRNWSKLVKTGWNWSKLVKIVKTGWNL